MRFLCRLTCVLGLAFLAWLGVRSSMLAADAASPWYVAPGGNDGASCLSPAAACATIQGAVDKAADGDEIRIATGIYRSSMTAVVAITKTLTLRGGWDAAFSSQNGLSQVDGEYQRRGFLLSACGLGREFVVTLERFRITRGNAGDAPNGGGLAIPCPGVATTLRDSLIDDNVGGSALFGGAGGGAGILNYGVLTITSSTLTNNRLAGGFEGVAIYNRGVLTIEQSTIADNPGTTDAIYNLFPGATLTLINSTVNHNGSIGIRNVDAHLVLQNTIVANHTFADCRDEDGYSDSQVTSLGHNVVGRQTCFTPAATDQVGVDPRLGPLQDNGGPTPTQALASDSPAVNQGPVAGCLNSRGVLMTIDQRGAPRMGVCDVGAFESTLGISKTVTGVFQPGGVVTYTLSLDTRGGALDLSDVQLTDVTPGLLTLLPQSLTTTGGSASVSDQGVIWTGTVSSTTPVVVTYSAVVSPQAVGQVITNTATGAWQNFSFASNTSVFDTFSRVRLPALARNACQDFSDDFSHPASGWFSGDSPARRAEYLDGEYRILSKQAGYLFMVRAPTCPRENYSVEADLRWEGPTGSDLGLLLGIAGSFDQFYMVDINTDYQAFAIYRFNADGSVTVIAPPQVWSAIHTGNSVNRVSVLRNEGYTLWITINDQIYTYDDWTISGLTGVGVVMAPYDDQPAADARFDNFRAYAYVPWTGSAVANASPIAETGVDLAVDWQPNLSQLRRVTSDR